MESTPAVLNTEIPTQQTQPQTVVANPIDLPVAAFNKGLKRRKENRQALMQWIAESLVEGVDFGRIHVVGKSKCPNPYRCQNPAHFSKACLFKPGAEKICGMLGLKVSYPSLSEYERAAIEGRQIKQIILRCYLIDSSGQVVADGVGARNAQQQDYGDINKALKMTEKSAHIDATLRMAGLSEIFTQDLEDMKHENTQKNTQASTSENRSEGAPEPAPKISADEHKKLEAKIKAYGLDRDRVKAWMQRATNNQCQSFPDLSPTVYNKLFKQLEVFAQLQGAEDRALKKAIQVGWQEGEPLGDAVAKLRQASAFELERSNYAERGARGEASAAHELERAAQLLERTAERVTH